EAEMMLIQNQQSMIKDILDIDLSDDEKRRKLIKNEQRVNNNVVQISSDDEKEFDEDEYPIRFTRSNTKTMSSRAPSHKFNLIDKLAYDEFDNDNIISEVTNDVQHYNSESLIAEPTVDVEDCDNFIDAQAIADEATHDEYKHDKATDDDFDI
nr:hypothetical protein [Tanacetum cinerariifolium]